MFSLLTPVLLRYTSIIAQTGILVKSGASAEQARQQS
jgi:hypothetical protein